MTGPVLGGDLAAAEAAFAASRGLFEQVSARMQSVDAGSLTHSQLERVLGADMREVTRQLYQDHLRLREITEVRAVAVAEPLPFSRLGQPTDGANVRAGVPGDGRSMPVRLCGLPARLSFA